LRVERIGAYLARLRNPWSGWRSTGRIHNVVKLCPFADTNTPHNSGPRLTGNLVNWRAENFSTAVYRPRVHAILNLVHAAVSGYSCTSRSRGTAVPTPNTSTSTSRGIVPL